MLEKIPNIQEAPDAIDLQYKNGEIEFKNITFGHKDDQPLFTDLNLKFNPGTTNAIVGPSGFGKTTMLHLMFRMYDPE